MGCANWVVPLAAAAAALVTVAPGRAAFADTPAASEPVQPAVWTPRELRFVYSGFTTTYSCDGLRDKMRKVLLKLGARKGDLEVNESACAGGPGQPTTFPTVNIKMNVLQPAPAPPPGANAPPAVAAHWRLVDLTKYRDPLKAAGNCELIEQIKLRILPLFTTRNVEFRSNCVPNQLQLGTVLKVEVLMADETQRGNPPPGAAPARPPGSQNPGTP
jgi:hypothetical protein